MSLTWERGRQPVMMKFGRQFGKFLLTMIFLLPVLAACSRTASLNQTPTPDGTFEIDPLLSEYFHSMGGEELFGPPISRLITRDGIPCQYTVNAPFMSKSTGNRSQPVFSLARWPRSGYRGNSARQPVCRKCRNFLRLLPPLSEPGRPGCSRVSPQQSDLQPGAATYRTDF